jgi:rod shape-determining protein MreC
MQNLINFIVKYYYVLIFVVLESISLTFLIQNNSFQKARFVNFTRSVSVYLYRKTSDINEYLSLKQINEELMDENTRLQNSLRSSYFSNKIDSYSIYDSLYKKQYQYFRAKVINSSVNKQFNYITINKGKLQGIKVNQAVICAKGVVGKVEVVSNNFSLVLPILNPNTRISSKVKKNGYFGPLTWDGYDYRYAYLDEIPQHVPVQVGDSVVTSGYSSIFPEGILVGTVTECKAVGGSFYKIKVKLSTDYKNLNDVMIVDYLLGEEQTKLENSIEHD